MKVGTVQCHFAQLAVRIRFPFLRYCHGYLFKVTLRQWTYIISPCLDDLHNYSNEFLKDVSEFEPWSKLIKKMHITFLEWFRWLYSWRGNDVGMPTEHWMHIWVVLGSNNYITYTCTSHVEYRIPLIMINVSMVLCKNWWHKRAPVS